MSVRRRVKLATLGVALTAASAIFASSSHAEDRAALFNLHKGGVLRLSAPSAAGTIDPLVNYDTEYWDLYFFTYDSLVALPKVPGPAGNVVVADLAEEAAGFARRMGYEPRVAMLGYSSFGSHCVSVYQFCRFALVVRLNARFSF